MHGAVLPNFSPAAGRVLPLNPIVVGKVLTSVASTIIGVAPRSAEKIGPNVTGACLYICKNGVDASIDIVNRLAGLNCILYQRPTEIAGRPPKSLDIKVTAERGWTGPCPALIIRVMVARYPGGIHARCRPENCRGAYRVIFVTKSRPLTTLRPKFVVTGANIIGV